MLLFDVEALDCQVPFMAVHAYNSSNLEAEAQGLWIQGQPVLHCKTVSKISSSQKHMEYFLSLCYSQQIICAFTFQTH